MLSSFNGEKYIKEQIQSIFNQKDVQVDCLIRDDGSMDRTVEIIKELCKDNKHIKLICGSNIGWRKSFMELLYYAGDYPFYCFSDQDDFWEDTKIISALKFLQNDHIPMLYYSNANVVDDNLHIIERVHGQPPVTNKKQILVQNFCQGCTMVLNKPLKDLCCEYKLQINVAHDIWIPIIATYFGKVIYDSRAFIYYRQHSDNIMGGLKTNIYVQIQKRNNSAALGENYYCLASELLTGYNEYLTENERIFLENIIMSRWNILKRLKLVFDPFLSKRTLKGTVLLKLMILSNKYSVLIDNFR